MSWPRSVLMNLYLDLLWIWRLLICILRVSRLLIFSSDFSRLILLGLWVVVWFFSRGSVPMVVIVLFIAIFLMWVRFMGGVSSDGKDISVFSVFGVLNTFTFSFFRKVFSCRAVLFGWLFFWLISIFFLWWFGWWNLVNLVFISFFLFLRNWGGCGDERWATLLISSIIFQRVVCLFFSIGIFILPICTGSRNDGCLQVCHGTFSMCLSVSLWTRSRRCSVVGFFERGSVIFCVWIWICWLLGFCFFGRWRVRRGIIIIRL